jgi:hypothetical protein
MEPKEITTPNGYKATLKSYLTYGESEQLKRVLTDEIKIKLSTNISSGKTVSNIDEKALAAEASRQMEMNEIPGSIMYKAKDMAARFLITKIVDAQGNDLGSGLEAVNKLPDIDGNFIMNEVERIRTGAEITQKKGS